MVKYRRMQGFLTKFVLMNMKWLRKSFKGKLVWSFCMNGESTPKKSLPKEFTKPKSRSDKQLHNAIRACFVKSMYFFRECRQICRLFGWSFASFPSNWQLMVKLIILEISLIKKNPHRKLKKAVPQILTFYFGVFSLNRLKSIPSTSIIPLSLWYSTHFH